MEQLPGHVKRRDLVPSRPAADFRGSRGEATPERRFQEGSFLQYAFYFPEGLPVAPAEAAPGDTGCPAPISRGAGTVEGLVSGPRQWVGFAAADFALCGNQWVHRPRRGEHAASSPRAPLHVQPRRWPTQLPRPWSLGTRREASLVQQFQDCSGETFFSLLSGRSVHSSQAEHLGYYYAHQKFAKKCEPSHFYLFQEPSQKSHYFKPMPIKKQLYQNKL